VVTPEFVQSQWSYADASLVDLDGSVLIRLNESRTDASQLKQRSRARLSGEAAASGEVALSDLSLDTRSGRPLMVLTIPVRDLGALILGIDPSSFLYPYLESWPTPSRTAETLLFRREGKELVALKEFRHAPGSALVLRGPLPGSSVPGEPELLSGWLNRGPDYRGVPSLSVVRRIPDSPWYLTAKIDVSEVEAPLTHLSWEMALIVVLILVGNGTGVGLIWRNQKLQTYRDREKEVQALNARLIGAQEEERARLARELHDDVSQQIAALSIGMSNLKRQIPPQQGEAREQTNRIHQKLVQVAESIRRLSHELHPAVLEYSGLAAALRTYCSEFELLTGIRVSLQAYGSFEGVPSPIALCIYRITQEALQNVAKHANVGEAEVELRRSDGILCLSVSDHGPGIKPSRAATPVGLGLVSIRERTRLVNGTFEIQSTPDQGTTLLVRIPA
jgi:signal transduction histidine kinase